MIVIQVRTEKETFETTFDKDCITIGAGSIADLSPPDLIVPEMGPDSIQVKIFSDDGQHCIINEMNNSSVTLNGLSFGKRSLREGDLIAVHDVLITIMILRGEAEEKNEPKDFSKISDDEQDEESIDEMSLLCKLDERDDEISDLSLPKNDFPEENRELSEKIPLSSQQHIYEYILKKWKPIASLLLILALFIGITISVVYLSGKEQGKEEELQAARSVADTSMGLLYAHLYDLKPHNQNWAASDFIKSSLNHILPVKYALCATNDFGELKQCRYMMRIYTDDHLSRFLLIAQPVSELMGWLQSRDAIILDSKDMQLRLLSDIKPLNRLLQTGTLNKIESMALSEALKKSKILPLAFLGMEFTPPKELAFIQPGSENFVYNAPRYYRFTEKWIDESMMITKKNDDQTNRRGALIKNYEKLSKLPSLVFYTSKGIKGAMLAYQALSIQSFSQELIGYLTLHSENKTMASSHLLLVKPELALKKEDEPIAESAIRQNDYQDSIWFQLMKNLALSRKLLLKPIGDQIMLLLHQHSQVAQPQFQQKFLKLLEEYEKIDREEKGKIPQAIDQLYRVFQQEEPHLSPKVFLSYLHIAGLETFLNEDLEFEILNSILEFDEREESLKESKHKED